MQDKTERVKGAEEDGKAPHTAKCNTGSHWETEEEGPRYHLTSLTPLPASQEMGTLGQSGKGLLPAALC